jgi:hypothetical protein
MRPYGSIKYVKLKYSALFYIITAQIDLHGGSQLFQLAVSRGPRVLRHCTADNIKLTNKLFIARRNSAGEMENITHRIKNWEGRFETHPRTPSQCLHLLPCILATALGIFLALSLYIYTGHTQKNGAVSKVNKHKPHLSFVYALYIVPILMSTFTLKYNPVQGPGHISRPNAKISSEGPATRSPEVTMQIQHACKICLTHNLKYNQPFRGPMHLHRF